jgi:hypothetical protein
MQRAMARQAEAERERRAKVIAAEGEYQAAEKLGMAADVIDAHPAALQLRYLQTLVEISAEKASTTIFPVPIDLIRPFIDAKLRPQSLPTPRPPAHVGAPAPQMQPQSPQRPLPPRTPPQGDQNG